MRELLKIIPDAGSEYANKIVSNKDILRIIVNNRTDESGIIGKIVSNIEKLNSDEQAGFINTLIGHMSLELSGENGLEITNMRDVALAILVNETNDDVFLREEFIPLVTKNITAVYDSYTIAIGAQDPQNDPYDGSIGALLKFGKAVGKYFSQFPQMTRGVVREWDIVLNKFPNGELKEYISSEVKAIEKRMSRTIELDEQVAQLKAEGNTIGQIAEIIGVSYYVIKCSFSRLRKKAREAEENGTSKISLMN